MGLSFVGLPIFERVDEILAAIRSHQVCVVAGETGSGKTTQLPRFCLQAGRGSNRMIGHTQPRRLAARSVAARIAEECGVELGTTVGYQVRFSDQTCDETQIKIMTDGILLNEIQYDKLLSRYDTLIIDEAHERSLTIDFILGYLKQLLPKRPDLKIIITSATIDVERFSQHFNQAPIIEVSGRTYPVETLYYPPTELNQDNDADLSRSIVNAVHKIIEMEACGEGFQHGDILVFLPGEREIRDTSLALKKAQLKHIEVMPLYARLSQNEQAKLFKQHAMRRIVLSTNIAETSLTVPGIRYVIDSGLARISRYSSRSKVQRLPIEPISQASANQRQGRCGRIAPGICIRLYSLDDFTKRPQYTEAEILRTNLAAVILQMMQLRLGKIEHFPFIDKPDNRNIKDGFHLLKEVGAINQNQRLTPTGKTMAKLPLDPRLARMIIAAERLGCLNEVLIIVSGLASQDPRETPNDKRQQARQSHARFEKSRSDFISWHELWLYHEDLRQQLSSNQLKKQLKREYLSYMRLREWRDIHRQLLLSCQSLKLRINQQPASTDTIHRAILAGLLSHIAVKQEKHSYLGARNRIVHSFPASSTFKKPPQWLMAAELVETSKLYARTCAQIDPEWVLPYAKHLIKKHYTDPAFSPRTGHVMANCRTSLYGLTLIEKQRVSYTSIDAPTCHQLFIRQGLVEGGYGQHKKHLPDFWQHNTKLIEQITNLEDKARKRDILVDDNLLYDFYAERIPQDISNVSSFEKWRQDIEKKHPQLLYFDKAMLMRHNASAVNQAQFPETLTINNHPITLNYHFEPGHRDDGVTAIIPLSLINQCQPHTFDWLIPGLLSEKCTEILKGLDKPLRKQLVPIPNFVAAILPTANPDKHSLFDFLSQAIRQKSGKTITPQQLSQIDIDDYYRMNFHIVDKHGQIITQGRNFEQILEQCRPKLKQVIAAVEKPQHSKCYHSWEFGNLSAKKLNRAGIELLAYPVLIDEGDSVRLDYIDNKSNADSKNRRGILRLIRLKLTKEINYIEKSLFKSNKTKLLITQSGYGKQFIDTLIGQILDVTFLSATIPSTQSEFELCLSQHKGELVTHANAYEALLLKIIELKAKVQSTLKQYKQLHFIATIKDINSQLAGLFNNDYIKTPFEQLKHYPRYLNAINYRLEKLANNPKESDNLDKIALYHNKLLQLVDEDWNKVNESSTLNHARWLVEEYRVSLFAQHMKTAVPVSSKRLEKAFKAIGS